LLAVEQALTRLPVPDGGDLARVAVLEKIKAGQPEPRPVELPPTKVAPAAPRVEPRSEPAELPLLPLPTPAPMLEEKRRRRWDIGRHASRLWPVGLVAATLLIATVAYFSLRGSKPQDRPSLPADPLLDNLVRLNVELARAQTPADSVKVIVRMADELNLEMREIARADATGDNMQALEGMYRRVVLKALVEQAGKVERSQREAVLGSVAKSLARAGDQAEQTAKEAPEHSAAALREAADTARQGTREMHRLIRGALS